MGLVGRSVRGAPTVAQLLGVPESVVLDWIASRELYVFLIGARRYFPAWQFVRTDGSYRRLVGLAPVLSALPPGLAPTDVDRFFTTPVPELARLGFPTSPSAWLRQGGDPARVAQLAAHLSR